MNELILSRLDELSAGQQKLIETVERLARVEERQTAALDRVERIEGDLEELERRVDALEIQAPANKRVGEWIDRAAWAAMAAVGVYAAKAVGLL